MASGTISAGAELINLIAEASSIVTTPTATDTLVQEISIPEGYHVVLISVSFRATNGNGSRKIMTSLNDETGKKNLAEIAPNPNGYTTVAAFTTYRVGACTLKIWTNQSSGSNMDVYSTVNDLVFN